MKIVADENIPLIHEFFDELGEVQTVAARELSREHTESADLLVVRSVVPIGRALLEDTPVKFVGSCTAGVDHLDTEAIEALGIRWSGAPGCNAAAVGDYVFSVLAALGDDFLSARVGIIGCGNVGGRLLQRLTALGIDCCAYDPFLSRAQQPKLVSLAEVLACDVVSIHAPLTKTGLHPSFHLLGSDELNQLRQGATLISAGRGGVVDNAALKALRAKRSDLRLVLDVWESEPDVDRELLEQVDFATPHIAGHSYDGKARGTEIIYQRACDFLQRPAETSFAELDRFKPQAPIVLREEGILPALREAILAVYDLREDHRRFVDALAHEAQPRQAFDQLRKHYPTRREFTSYEVEPVSRDPQLVKQLRALGFQLKAGEGK